MGIFNRVPADLKEVDVIIAGGGTAGCVVASRLAQADPGLSILVIERGKDNYNLPNIVHPVITLQNLVPSTKSAIFYQANKAPQLADRSPIVPSGGILGGGSSINFMMYTRAQRSDFDSWKTPGWTADEMLPFLKKLETYHGPGSLAVHGTSGPIHVSDGTFRSTRAFQEFINAAKQLGIEEYTDLQDLDSNNGVATWPKTIGLDGRRQDAAHCYLQPLLRDPDGNLNDQRYPNVHVLTETLVLRVLFDEGNGNDNNGGATSPLSQKRATGVEFTPNPEHQAVTPMAKHPVHQVRARRLVIISSGACGTPSILERSGIGNKDILTTAGVAPVIADLPGVGHDYQDHQLDFYPYHSSLEEHETLDSAFAEGDNFEAALAKAGPFRTGWNSLDAAGKLRPTEAEVAALGPEFKAAWDRDFKDTPNRPLAVIALTASYIGVGDTVPPGQYISLGTFTTYPYSRGHIHITGPSPTDPLDFSVGFLSDPHDLDLKQLVWLYKKQREIARRTTIYRGEVASRHPEFPAGSKASCATFDHAPVLDGPVADIEYTPEDDAAIEQFIRENVSTTWHSLGTAKMAPREEGGVVDGRLNVHGVAGLKVADLSIPPENVGGNTNNTALAIGEKCADIVLREFGIL